MRPTVAVIPARGGSKGIPGKNLARVGGVPLVARAIVAARSAASIDRVVVSTDDDEIAAVSREWGATVVRRPAAIAGDAAPSESALMHALTQLEGDDVETRVLVFIQATSPFISPDDLDRAVALITDGAYDAVFSAVETFGFLWAPDAAGDAHGVNHGRDSRPRRQDRDPHYLETGAFYAMDARGFADAGHRFFGRVGIVEVAERSAIEIDAHEHLAIARAISPLFASASEPIDVDAVVTDFDGVHTDDSAYVDATGRETVRVSRSDGMGIGLLRRAGVPVLILSTETNPVVGARARKLQVDVRQALDDKVGALRDWAASVGVPLSRIAYLGNDVNDLPAMEAVGWPVAVADAHPLVLAAARVTIARRGGAGAVRELADRVLAGRPADGTGISLISPINRRERSTT